MDFIEVPFRFDRMLMIPITFEEGKTLHFALDTGSPVIAIIGHKKTKTINFELGAELQFGGSGADSTPTVGRMINDLQLSIGNVTLQNQTAIWIPWDQMSFFESEKEVFLDGIIGYDIFKRFVVELDFDITEGQPASKARVI